MQMKEAISEFLNGYFSMHQRSRKTRIAYEQDLEQFGGYAGMDFELRQSDRESMEVQIVVWFELLFDQSHRRTR